MKILAIRLKNLTSIEGKVEIDFTQEPLKSAGIFSITGKTGAGKSTLLDALCLALYDKAPRFAACNDSYDVTQSNNESIKQSDVRNMLRRGTADGYAEVDFLAVDGFRYRSTWLLRRSRNKVTGSLQHQEIKVLNLDTNELLPGRKTELLKELVRLVGLTYEQFTRTVLLAQNDFATFLKSKGNEKAELLEKLTGTELYSAISVIVFQRTKEVNAELDMLRQKMNDIKILSKEDFDELKREGIKAQELRLVQRKELEKINQNLQLWKDWQNSEEGYKIKKEKELQESKSCEEIKKRVEEEQNSINQLNEKWKALEPDVKRARELDAIITTKRANVKNADELYRAELKKYQEHLKKYKQEYSKFEKALTSIKEKLQGKLTSEFSVEAAKAYLDGAEEQLNHHNAINEQLDAQLKSYNYSELHRVYRQKEKELKLYKDYTQKNEEFTKEQKKLAKLSKQQCLLEGLFNEKKGALTTAKEQYNSAQLIIGKDIKSLRANLKPGHACPVCGSKEHPFKGEEQLNKLFTSAEEIYKKAEENYQKVNNEYVAVKRDVANVTSLINSSQAELNTIKKQLPESISLESIDKELKELQLKINEYDKLYKEWEKQNGDLKRERKVVEELKELLYAYRLADQKMKSENKELNLNKSNMDSYKVQYDRQKVDLLEQEEKRSKLLKGMAADDAENAVKNHVEKHQKELEKLNKDFQQKMTNLATLQGEIKQLLRTLKELEAKKKELPSEDKLKEQLQQVNQQLELSEEKCTNLKVRVKQQEENLETFNKFNSQLKEKEVVSQQWNKLNALIGSASGAKFKDVAQSFTLNILLTYANHHLTYLSSRYRLEQIPNTLGLQIVDRDMCDEVRPVYSLSGGESFLVSLALALGLSSLSSNNLRVDSLFIDEGFGSLDADSLRTAMEALEQLQMQGRKIGVISHVQEMSERVAVQVFVNKKSNGKSELSIIG